MNGYAEVSFSRDKNATRYIYAIPDYVDFETLSRNYWAIVENNFFDKRYDISPYKIAYIQSVSMNNPRSFEPTKYIVDVIKGDEYKAIRDTLRESVDLNNYFKNLPLNVKRAICKDVENGWYE